MITLTVVFHLLFLGCMAWAAVTDLLTFRIFNSLIVTLLAGFVAWALVEGLLFSSTGLATLGWHVLASLAAFALFLVFYIIGQMGAGDVKLIAATALWFGWHPVTLNYILYAMIAGGVLTVLLYGWRKLPLSEAASKVRFIKRLHVRRLKTPYGITLGLTAAYLSFQSPTFIN